MTVRILCICGKKTSTPEAAIGKIGACPACGRKIFAARPAPEGESAPGPADAARIASLVERLVSAEASERRAAARALGALGEGARGAAGSLLDRLEERREPDHGVRRAVALALGRVGPLEVAVPALIDAIEDVPESAGKALVALGARVLPALQRAAAKAGDAVVRRRYAAAASSIIEGKRPCDDPLVEECARKIETQDVEALEPEKPKWKPPPTPHVDRSGFPGRPHWSECLEDPS